MSIGGVSVMGLSDGVLGLVVVENAGRRRMRTTRGTEGLDWTYRCIHRTLMAPGPLASMGTVASPSPAAPPAPAGHS